MRSPIGGQRVIQLRWFAIQPEPSCYVNWPAACKWRGTFGLVVVAARKPRMGQPKAGATSTKLTWGPRPMRGNCHPAATVKAYYCTRLTTTGLTTLFMMATWKRSQCYRPSATCREAATHWDSPRLACGPLRQATDPAMLPDWVVVCPPFWRHENFCGCCMISIWPL